MRAALAMIAIAACGRIDFAPNGGSASGDAGSGGGGDSPSNVVANRAFVTSTLQAAGSFGDRKTSP